MFSKLLSPFKMFSNQSYVTFWFSNQNVVTFFWFANQSFVTFAFSNQSYVTYVQQLKCCDLSFSNPYVPRLGHQLKCSDLFSNQCDATCSPTKEAATCSPTKVPRPFVQQPMCRDLFSKQTKCPAIYIQQPKCCNLVMHLSNELYQWRDVLGGVQLILQFLSRFNGDVPHGWVRHKTFLLRPSWAHR